jgi:hypothetical protein
LPYKLRLLSQLTEVKGLFYLLKTHFPHNQNPKSMNYEKTFDNFDRLHHLIKKKGTGTPKHLSEKFKVALGTVNNWIKLLRNKGLPIVYCRKAQTYYYEYEVEVIIFRVIIKKS